MNKIREALETAAIYICGTIIVLMMTTLYLLCRLLGLEVDE